MIREILILAVIVFHTKLYSDATRQKLARSPNHQLLIAVKPPSHKDRRNVPYTEQTFVTKPTPTTREPGPKKVPLKKKTKSKKHWSQEYVVHLGPNTVFWQIFGGHPNSKSYFLSLRRKRWQRMQKWCKSNKSRCVRKRIKKGKKIEENVTAGTTTSGRPQDKILRRIFKYTV